MDVAALHAASGEGDAEHFWPVVAAAGGVDLGRATKLGVDHDECGIEQPAFVEIADEGRVGFVEIGHLESVGALDIVVVIPAAVGKGDETDTGFDEAAREKHALAGGVATVVIADFLWLGLDVERGAGLV